METPWNLQRFVEAQDGGVYETVLSEIRGGAKRSHWMWFIFPQLAGLGLSPTAQFYAIGSVEEAQAYLDHPLLGARLREYAAAAAALLGRSARQVFGQPDDLKLRSSLTLFEAASAETVFTQALETLCAGQRDPATLRLLERV